MEKTKSPSRPRRGGGNSKKVMTAVIALMLIAIVAAAAAAFYIRPDLRWLAADALFSSPAGTMPRGEDADGLRGHGGLFAECSEFTLEGLLSDPRVSKVDHLMLINAQRLLPSDYRPDLVSLSGGELSASAELCAAFASLNDYCKEHFGEAQRLIVTSAYRTREEQIHEISENKEVAQTLDASEHQAGLALDLCVKFYGGRSFLKTDAGRYVNSHAAEYGLIMRYPYWGKKDTGISFEPWHVRYVGTPHAALISENRLTLEEYIEALTPGLYFVSGEYIITRQSASDTFVLPSGFLSAEVSPDNTGYYIITARMPASGA